MGQPSDPWLHNTPPYGAPVTPQPAAPEQPGRPAGSTAPRAWARVYHPRRRRRILGSLATLTILVLLIAVVVLACRPTTPPLPPPSSSSEPSYSPGPTTEQAEPTPTVTTASSVPEGHLAVPDGVGMNYQSAQDLWRDAGLHVLPAYDALGKRRLPIIDRNWEVVSQEPPAGTIVEKGSFIRATVKKHGETVP